MAVAGRVAIVPKGEWSADVTYKRLDAVTYNNTLYFAKKDVPTGTATSNTEYWSKSIVGGVGAIATTEDAGVVKPDGKSMSVDESGTLSINLDGTTITLDEAKNVIKLADALKEKIGSALQPESIVNNQVTTEAGFALDARQANPSIDGTLAKQISDLNGSLKNDINALNPSSSIKTYVEYTLGESGMGWYRFAEIIFENSSLASGALCHCIEILIMQMYNFAPGCFHKINIYMKITDSAKITAIGQNAAVLKKVRAVRKDNIIFLDIYSSQINNYTYVLLNIPFGARITSAKCIEPYLVPETSDGEVIVCSVDLADNI
jgi:hypothetical protein